MRADGGPTYDELSVPLQLQDLRRVLLDHEQLLLPQHLLLGEELELGRVLQRAACAVHPRPHRAATLQYIASCRNMEEGTIYLLLDSHMIVIAHAARS